MVLYVLQHGDAVPGDVDPERPLSDQGVRDVRRLAMHMKKLGLRPREMLHSGKLRAAQSARLIAETLAPEVEPHQADGLKPNDDPAQIVGRLEQARDSLLIAGHMPFVSRLCSMLLTGTTDAEFASAPGTLICLENAGDRWRVACMLRPDCI